MAAIKAFKISIPEATISALNAKLESAVFPNELSDAEWSMGSPLSDIKRLTKYWREKYSWRKAEAHLNTFPQFTTEITIPGFSPLDIHFIHQRSKREDAIPLLFIHGWPGSYFEVLKLLPLLTDSTDPNVPSFHIIAPSLPNFGWSQGPNKKGFGLKQYAQVLHSLMTTLGYTEYVAQGGDWGSFLSRLIGHMYPSSVKAVHINMATHGFPKLWRNPISFLQTLFLLAFSPTTRADLAHTQNYLTEGDSYLKQQDTRPQTLAYGLTDSPVGLLAWIYEKLHAWTDAYPWTEDEVLTWVSIYVFSREGPGAAGRIYYESVHPIPSRGGDGEAADHTAGPSRTEVITSYYGEVPLALAYFPREIVKLPLCWAWSSGRVVQQSVFEVGGHFAAFEVPQLLAQDLRKLFGRGGACEGAVAGKKGF